MSCSISRRSTSGSGIAEPVATRRSPTARSPNVEHHGPRPAIVGFGAETKQINFAAGELEYMDIGRDGPTIVLLHGLLMDGSLWHNVATELARDHRCVVPTLPLGAHRCGMRADADLSVAGIAALVRELIERLDLHDVTIAGVDTGGAIAQLLMGQNVPRIGRAVLISCDAFENFPPGLTGKALVMAGKLPPALFGVFMQQLRLRWMRRLPIAYGWLTKTGDAATKLWLRPLLTQPEVRRDTVRVLRAIAAEPQLLVDASTGLPGFAHPTLVIWAAGDRVMPPEHGRRLAELLPQARLVEVDDTYTLIPLDQPGRLIELMREFTNSTDRQAG